MTKWVKLNLQCYLPPGGYTVNFEKFIIKKEEDGFSLLLKEMDYGGVPNLSTTYDGSSLRTIVPIEEENGIVYKFQWSSFLSLSEDRGMSGLISNYNFQKFHFEQIITNTLIGRTPPNKTFVDRIPIVLVATPYKGCSLDDCIVFILSDDGTEHEGFDFDHETPLLGKFIRGECDSDFPGFMNKIQINGPDSMNPDSTLELEIIPPYENQTVYIEYDSGYVNKTKFKGTNKILLDSKMLSSGDKITIKAGYKYWVSDCKKIISIN